MPICSLAGLLIIALTAQFISNTYDHTISGNHKKIAKDVGYSDRREYRYYNKETRGLDLHGMLEDLQVSNISPSRYTVMRTIRLKVLVFAHIE